MQISVKTDVKTAARQLNRVQKRQIPFASARALSQTAEFAATNLNNDTREYLDNPTPFTQKAFRFKRATKQNQTALVFAAPIQDEYLQYAVFGGTRRPRGRALILPVGIKLNKYGNIPRTAIRRLLGRTDTFSATIRGVAGIWQRTRRGTRLLVAYESSASYEKRFPVPALVSKYVTRAFPPFFDRSLSGALRTAR